MPEFLRHRLILIKFVLVMPTNLIGVTVGADQIHVVLLEQNGSRAFTLADETTMNLQEGDRSAAYDVLHGQLFDYIRQHKAGCVCIKGSALSMGGTKMAHLEAAELRGVVRAAAASSSAEVRIMTKAAASRNFGTRKVDEYLKDDNYWGSLGLGSLRKGMREAAFAVIAEFCA
jgi:hypothetical protein